MTAKCLTFKVENVKKNFNKTNASFTISNILLDASDAARDPLVLLLKGREMVKMVSYFVYR